MKLISLNIAAGLTAVILLQGCTGTNQDPRISMCLHLASDLNDSKPNIMWTDAGEDIVRPEYAKVNVKSDTGSKASCFYEYDTVEENALTQSDPLSAYATLPYQMELNGEKIASLKLKAAVMARQTKLGQEVLKKTQEAVDKAKQEIQKSLDQLHTSGQ